jgi:hypothetical protein
MIAAVGAVMITYKDSNPTTNNHRHLIGPRHVAAG